MIKLIISIKAGIRYEFWERRNQTVLIFARLFQQNVLLDNSLHCFRVGDAAKHWKLHRLPHSERLAVVCGQPIETRLLNLIQQVVLSKCLFGFFDLRFVKNILDVVAQSPLFVADDSR
jgi:hypothetical protein